MTSGLPWAKLDSAFPMDRKWRTLERRLPWDTYLQAVGLWTLVMVDAWRVGSPEDGLAADGDLDAPSEVVQALQTVGLLDQRGRIPTQAWDKWGGAAMEEVRAFRSLQAEKGRIGGRKRAEQASRSEAGRFQPSPAPGLEESSPRPARGLESSSPAPDKRESRERVEREPPGGGSRGEVLLTKAQLEAWEKFDASSEVAGTGRLWEPTKRAWMGRGFRHPPTAKQRAILWELLEARPTDLPRWIREAPRNMKTTRQVIDWCLSRMGEVAEEAERRDRQQNGKNATNGMTSLREVLEAAQSRGGAS